MVLGYALYAALNLWLVVADSRWEMVGIFCLYGVFYAIEESQSKAFIADLEPKRRATAVGVYNFVTGSLYLPASLIRLRCGRWRRAWLLGWVPLSVAAMVVFMAVKSCRRAATLTARLRFFGNRSAATTYIGAMDKQHTFHRGDLVRIAIDAMKGAAWSPSFRRAPCSSCRPSMPPGRTTTRAFATSRRCPGARSTTTIGLTSIN